MSTKTKKIREENDKHKIQVSDNGKDRGKRNKDESCTMALELDRGFKDIIYVIK